MANNYNNDWAPPQHPRMSMQQRYTASHSDRETQGQFAAQPSFTTSNFPSDSYLSNSDTSFGTATTQDNINNHNPNAYAGYAGVSNSSSTADNPPTIDPAVLHLGASSTQHQYQFNITDILLNNTGGAMTGRNINGNALYHDSYSQGHAQFLSGAAPTRQDPVFHPILTPLQAPSLQTHAPQSRSSLPGGDSGSYGYPPANATYYHLHGHHDSRSMPPQRMLGADSNDYRTGRTHFQRPQLNGASEEARARHERIGAMGEDIESVMESRGMRLAEAAQLPATQAAQFQMNDPYAGMFGTADEEDEEGSEVSTTRSSRSASTSVSTSSAVDSTAEFGAVDEAEELSVQDEAQGFAETSSNASSDEAEELLEQDEAQDLPETSWNASSEPSQVASASSSASNPADSEESGKDYSVYPTAADVVNEEGFRSQFSSANAARDHAFRRIKIADKRRDDVEVVKGNQEHYALRITQAIVTSTYLGTAHKGKRHNTNLKPEDKAKWTRWQEETGEVLNSVMSESDKAVLITQIQARAWLIVEEIIKVHEKGYRPCKSVDTRSICSERMEKAIKCVQDFTKVREDIMKVFDFQRFAADPEQYGQEKVDSMWNNKQRAETYAATLGMNDPSKKRLTTLDSAIYQGLYSKDEIIQKKKGLEGGDDEELAAPKKKRGVKRSMNHASSVDPPAAKRTKLQPEAALAKKTKASAPASADPTIRTTRETKAANISVPDASGMDNEDVDEGNEFDDAGFTNHMQSYMDVAQCSGPIAATTPVGMVPQAQNLSSTYGNIDLASTPATGMQPRRSLRGKQSTSKGERKQG